MIATEARMLKIISHLLDYPTPELFAASAELDAEIVSDSNLSDAEKSTLRAFVKTLTAKDIFDAQERYDLLFDRGRSLSLLLFEHVHGESRDRGQAMVDLMNVYQSKGFEVASSQLPDYLPLFLEFLSEQSSEVIHEWLSDIAHLLAMLSERLSQRECDYQILFDCLLSLSKVEVDRVVTREEVAKETRDDTVEAIDQAWQDKEIRFDDPMTNGCSSASTNGSLASTQQGFHQQNEMPIKWHQTEAADRAAV